MTAEEIKKALANKKECVEALQKYMDKKGHTLPNGEDAFIRMVKYNQEIKQLEYDLSVAEAMPDDEIIAMARGEQYHGDKDKLERDRKEMREILALPDEEERKDIQEQIKAGK